MTKQTKIALFCWLAFFAYLALGVFASLAIGNAYHSGVGWLVGFVFCLPLAGFAK